MDGYTTIATVENKAEYLKISGSWLIEGLDSVFSGRSDLLPLDVVNAVWAVVVWQYTGEEDVKILSASQSRDDIGDKLSSIVVGIDGSSKFFNLVRQIQSQSPGLSSGHELTSPAPAEARSGSPLGGIITRVVADGSDFSNIVANVDALFTMLGMGGELFAVLLDSGTLEATLRFSPSVLNRDQAWRYLSTFAHAMNLCIQHHQEPLRTLDLVSTHDKTTLWDWNRAQLPETVEACVHDLFRQRAREQPDMPAVDAWDGKFTYRELDTISDGFAAMLVSQEGVGPETIVPLCFEKCCWAMVALMGVIKAGGAIVFIDPANPVSRRQEIMNQIRTEFVITSKDQAAAWNEMGMRTVVVDNKLSNSLSIAGSSEALESRVIPANLLYLIFTSGSTGTPKGCLIEHRAFVSGALQHAAKSNLTRDSRVLQLAAYSFDVSMLEILTSLISGACVCTPNMASLAQGLAPIVNGLGITWSFLTPSLVKLMRPQDVPGLKTLALGGEPLHKVDIETWAPHLQLINGYGPSECSVAAAGDPHLEATSDPSNIGRAVGGLCWIVNAENHDQLVPLGAVGELLISGPILARGYLNDAGKTAASFINDPLWAKGWSLDQTNDTSRTETMRFYKTGDLARFNSDGTIQLLGRKDTQVKLRGLRIELGEIEHHMAQHSLIRHVAAFLPKDGPCKDKIVAVMSLQDGEEVDSKPTQGSDIKVIFDSQTPGTKDKTEEIKTYLSRHVPEYMIPAMCIVIESWPLLASAKLDRKKIGNWLSSMEEELYRDLVGLLPAEEVGEAETDSITAYSTSDDDQTLPETEYVLRDMFARSLGVSSDSVPMNKSFIGLGGDSLAAMRIVSECKRLGLTVTIQEVLKSQGIIDLAARVDALGRNGTTGASDGTFSLSRAQRAFTFQDMASDNHNNESFLLRLDGKVTPARLKGALAALVGRHSALRTRILVGSQTIAPRVEGSFRFKLHTVEHGENMAVIAAAAQRSVKPSGPVFSADLIRLDGKQILLVVAHCAVVDSASWGIVIADLETYLAKNFFVGEVDRFAFQKWANCEAEVDEEGMQHPTERIQKVNLDFWAMTDRANLQRDVIVQTVELDEVTSTTLLDGTMHRVLRTDAADFLITSLLCSFGQSFPDREDLPAISVWDDSRWLDGTWEERAKLSPAVGRFEALLPLAIDADGSARKDLVGMLKRTKDARRKGLRGPAFDGKTVQSEISFCFRNFSSILDRPKGLLRREQRPPYLPRSLDTGNNVAQPSLISILAEVIGDRIQLSLSYNRNMRHQARIWSWIAEAQTALLALTSKIAVCPIDYSLSDFPLLSPLTYDDLEKLLQEKLPQSGLGSVVSSIEDIYPCSPMQQDLLLSQSRAPGDGVYEHYHIAEVKPFGQTDGLVDASRLAEAWGIVVQRHTSLRTVFVASEDGDSLFHQVVLSRVQPATSLIECQTKSEADAFFASQAPVTFRGSQPPHRLTICRVADDPGLLVKLDINHAIVDGGSVAVILRDLVLAYNRQQSILSEPAFRFRDYIAYIRRTSVSSSLDFWANYLKHQTPSMFPKLAALEGPVGERKLNQVNVGLEKIAGETLSNYCQNWLVTRANVFQTAWALVLRQYTDSTDSVCFGYLSAGRDAPLPGIQDGVGAFLTMLISRFVFSTREKTLKDFVRMASEDYAASLPHQHVGLSNMQHSLKTGGNPLFNTIIAFNRDPDTTESSTIAFNPLVVYDPDEYDITVDVRFSGRHGVHASLRYWSDSLTEGQARSVASAFTKALETIVLRPSKKLRQVDLVSDYHLDRLQAFNDRALPRAERLMFSRFEEHAKSQPDAQAVCAWDGSWSYRELDDQATRLAHFLRTLGVKPEGIVPHCFQKSGWAVVTCLAILKAGGAFVGLDPTHPKQMLWKLVDDVGAAVVCVSPQNAQVFEDKENLRLVTITKEFVRELPAKNGRPSPGLTPDNAACVVFTSGTTGRPKAIVLEHASMATTSDLMGPVLKMGRDSRVFQFASYTFDVSNQDVFTTLQRGGCVCVPSEIDRVNDPAGAIERLRANHANLTSTMIGLMHPNQATSLKTLINLGEPLARENVEVWAPAVEMYNTYGPAEASVSITCSPTRLNSDSRPSNIGKPYGCWAWITDAADYNRLVPLGAVGELLIEGPLLARHYHNNPHKTAESFVWNPSWAKELTPGQDRRFYRTGDLCRFNSDGTLSIVGRRDTQVKIHGQRVELDGIAYEIQGVMRERSLVTVDVLPHPQDNANKMLAAFIQLLDYDGLGDSEPEETKNTLNLALPMTQGLSEKFLALQRALKARLPSHTIPTIFIPIRMTPRTANGKLARDVLRNMVAGLDQADLDRYMLKETHVGSRGLAKPTMVKLTAQEELLQELWSNVLSVPMDSIRTDDIFFHLGGDSVMAMRLVGAARAKGVSLTVADIFRFPVFSDMAKALSENTNSYTADQEGERFDLVDTTQASLESIRAEAADQCEVSPEHIVDLYPCTPLQQGLMALSTRNQGAYKAQRVFKISSPGYDIEPFCRAVDVVVRAEAILRTRIVNTTSGILQAVLDLPVRWTRHSSLQSYLKQDSEIPIRYGSQLLRLALIADAQSETRYIVWSAHHALYDGFSMDITFEQVSQALNGIPLKSVPFKNLVRYLHEQGLDDDSSARAYWTSQFPAGTWGLVVARHLDSSDAIIGVTLSGRDSPVNGISTMNGPTITTVPFRIAIDTEGDATINTYLSRIQSQASEMTKFQHTGIQNIRRFNEQARAAIDNMAHLFVVQPAVLGGDLALPGMELVPTELSEFYTDPLVIRNHVSDDGTVSVEVKYDHTVVSDEHIQRLLDQYSHAVQQLCNSPSLLLSEVDILSPQDIAQVKRWNGEIPETIAECIHHLIREQTDFRPDQPAVCAWDGSFTFKELDKVSNKLAAQLQNLGHARRLTDAGVLPSNRVIPIDQDYLNSLGTMSGDIQSHVSPSNAAIIVFTSGSTGRPKGAIIEHRGLCSMQHYEGPHVGIGPGTRTLQFASHVFDVSNSEVFTTLMRGGCVCIPSEEERMNDLAGAIEKYKVDWSFQVPTTAETIDPDLVPGLQYLALGGEAIRQGLCDRWAGRLKLLNSYGPSECSIWTSVSQIMPGSTTPNNIGRGLGCRTWITDKNNHNRLVAIGCVGELCVEGPIVTRGYKGNPQQTAAAYIENPLFARELGIGHMRIYKTGDLVRYEPDGTLLYVGRKDSQVKVRGQRIELSEVEHHIMVANGAGLDADAVAVEKVVVQHGSPEMPDQVALAAFLHITTAAPPRSVQSRAESQHSPLNLTIDLDNDATNAIRDQLVALRRSLFESIPPHMVPSFFIPLRQMPVTATGKKDRKILRSIGASLSKDQRRQYALFGDREGQETTKHVDDRVCVTDAEKQLRSLWAQVLGIRDEQTITADDNFFLKGGDSIQAMRLASAVRRVGKTITVSDMFKLPRLYQMATLLEQGDQVLESGVDIIPPFSLLGERDAKEAVLHAATQCGVKSEDIEDIYPCTPLQEGLMVVSTHQLRAYVSTRVFDIGENVNITRFKGAWQKAFDIFPILRTRIVLGTESESLQVVLKSTSLEFADIDTSDSARLLSHVEYGGTLCAFGIDFTARKFVWAVHHAIYDGWSATVLLSAVEKLYRAEEPYSPGPSFNNFVRQVSLSVNSGASNDFWRTQLSNSGGSSPAHFPKLPNKTYQARATDEFIYSFQLPRSHETHPELHPAILKTTLLKAAWAMVTARHSESPDITFGVAQSGRDCPVPGIEEIVGPVITTVPVRVQIDYTRTVEQFLSQIQDQSVAMIAHQHAGLQTLRGLGKEVQAALEFKSLFVFQRDDDAFVDGSRGFLEETSSPELMSGFYPYPIVIECTLAADGATVKMLVRHDPLVVPMHEVRWLCQQFSHVVDQLGGTLSADSTLQDVDILATSQLMTIRAWSAAWPYDKAASGRTVVQAIAEQVRRRPATLAIRGWDGDMTYAELGHIASRLARFLVATGVGPETMVPLCFDKSKWAVVASLAVVMAGGAFAHIGPAQPLERKKDILQATRSSFVLTSRRHEVLFYGTNVSVIPIDEHALNEMKDSPAIQFPQLGPHNSVYVSFTSGSTGKPKGITVEHGNLALSAQEHGSRLGVNPGTRVLQFSAYTFDIGLGDIFISLQRGATICIPSEWERINDLPGAITKYQADWLSTTPSVVAELLGSPEAVPSLRTLAIGGESPTEENIKTWSEKVNLQIWWGPTETTIYASSTPALNPTDSPLKLGNPMGCSMWLCEPNDHNRLTPLGCVGEIVVEGPLVARGYLDEEAKTAAAFVRDPHWANGLGRMYKTGDLARYDADGCMVFLGRKDNQVKVHGQRVELGEIEHNISTNESVRQVAVRVPKRGLLADRLVALLSLHEAPDHKKTDTSVRGSSQIVVLANTTDETSALRRALQDILPSYMVPSVWICVETIPLNPSGKMDRKCVDAWLEEMDQNAYQSLLASSEKTDDLRPPSNPTEAALCQILSQILSLKHISLDQSFLSLGGDSLTAMQLRNQARSAGIILSIQDIIKSKTISELASRAEIRNDAPLTSTTSRTELLGVPFGLSPIQKMFFDIIDEASEAGFSHDMERFDQSFVMQIKEGQQISTQQLHEALTAVVHRHSMLRARFIKQDGSWSQYLTDDSTTAFRLGNTDLQYRSQLAASVDQLGDGRADHTLNLDKGPLFLAHLFNVRDSKRGEQLLLVRAHHLVIDVVSWHILLGDLESFLLTGSFAGRPAPALSFQSWIHLQKEMVQPLNPFDLLPRAEIGNISLPDFEYWGMENKPNIHGDVVESQFLLEEGPSTQMLAQHGAALVDIVLAALIHTFASIFPDRMQTLPPVFLEGHGRESWNDKIDPSNTVGWFTTITPVVASTAAASSFLTTFHAVRAMRSQTPANGMPYFSSRYLSSKGRQAFASHHHMEILFNYLGRSQESNTGQDALYLPATLTEEEKALVNRQGDQLPRFALFDISAEITRNHQIRVTFAYNKKARHQEKISQWFVSVQKALQTAADALAQPVIESPILEPPRVDETKEEQPILKPVRRDAETAVERIYPCVPMQQHMLTARKKDPERGLYEMELSFSITTPTGDVDIERLQSAWQNVVDRHAVLRTIFVPGPSPSGGREYRQAVLRRVRVEVGLVECADETDMRTQMASFRSVKYSGRWRETTPSHRLTVFRCPALHNGHDQHLVACKLEIDHALTDGVSIALTMHDLALAYDGRLPSSPATGFGEYAMWLSENHHHGHSHQDNQMDIEYWRRFIQAATGGDPCLIPHRPFSAHSAASSTRSTEPPEHKMLTINLDEEQPVWRDLPILCARHGITMATLFQAAWGLVLHRLTPTTSLRRSTLFGYMTANRDSGAVEDLEQVVGPVINLLLCRTAYINTDTDNISKDDVLALLHRQRDDFFDSLEHQYGVAKLMQQEQLREETDPRFNSVMSLQYLDSRVAAPTKDVGIRFDMFAGRDPNAWDVTVGVQIRGNGGGVGGRGDDGTSSVAVAAQLGYWSHVLADDAARDVGDMFCRIIFQLVGVLRGNE
ncbi:hypothetical protein QBC47DRAFT_461558 [Echria macrotheca]|uniref:Carrier domain-containing protein n=1 Tax=Echria macrotheca TaxID=438768 RepID=A0AAJ0BA18_9PEZI|nr:hypothetical protein QBC47DRAFT_461558 [Echria macrotheca]